MIPLTLTFTYAFHYSGILYTQGLPMESSGQIFRKRKMTTIMYVVFNHVECVVNTAHSIPYKSDR